MNEMIRADEFITTCVESNSTLLVCSPYGPIKVISFEFAQIVSNCTAKWFIGL